jgi:hypothetical protein
MHLDLRKGTLPTVDTPIAQAWPVMRRHDRPRGPEIGTSTA